MSDSIRGNDGYPSLKMSSEELRKRQKKEVDTKTSDRLRDEFIEGRIAGANVKNRRLLPSYVPEKEEKTVDDDIVKYATLEDVLKIIRILKKIELRLGNIEDSLRKHPKKRGED